MLFAHDKNLDFGGLDIVGYLPIAVITSSSAMQYSSSETYAKVQMVFFLLVKF
jgi:hypothetical protein